MNGKERILATLAGEATDRVPFAPNIWQWFYANEYNGTLPPGLEGMHDPVEVLAGLGADILSKFDSGFPVPVYNNCGHAVEFEGALPPGKRLWASFTTFDGGTIRRDRIETPSGVLTHTWEYRADTGAPFESEHWWKDFGDYAAIRTWLEDTTWHPDLAAYAAGRKRIGNRGTFIFQLLPSPLKQFHWLAGQVNASYFVADHPAEMHALARLWEQKSLDYLDQVLDLDDVWIYEVADNLDSPFYPPRWFEAFCVPVLQSMAQRIHARGKYLFIHACGRLKALAPLFVTAGLDCVEGQAPPPMGDWYLHQARELDPRLIVCGGMAAPEQELTGPGAAGQIDAYVRELFGTLGDRRRFVFASSCNTSPRTPYANLRAFRDAAFAYGRF